MKITRFIIAALLGTLLGSFLFWWNSPHQIIARKTSTLVQSISFPATASKTKRQLDSCLFSSFLAPQISLPSVSNDPNILTPKAEIESAYAWICDTAQSSQITLEKVHSSSIKGSEVTISFDANVQIQLPNSSENLNGHYSASITWINLNHEWKVHRASWQKK